MSDATTWPVTIDVPSGSGIDGAGESHEIEVGEGEFILAAARREGLWLPADCQQGWCITCAAKLIEGEVDHGAAKRYFDADEVAGFVLPCVAKPRSPVHIEAAKYDEMLRVRADNDQPPGRSKLDR